MCLIVFEISEDPARGLLLAANRDEFYDRPTLAAAAWEDAPEIYSGRDLVGGGTWLGISQSRRFAAVTNYRDPKAPKGSRSRGELVSGFLSSGISTRDYLDTLASVANEFSGFNLIVGEASSGGIEAAYFSNREGLIRRLEPGVYGLSNHLLDTPWPKVRRARKLFSTAAADDDNALFELLSDRTFASDDELPDTGIGLERERLLSPIFIETPIYGTRCSTVVRLNADRPPQLIERVYV
ncbi:MAG: NRDE family protein [Acidobacteria bacterium]|nr:NRDE family protein [Acidobacteriota bacterium]